jgi:heat shock protein HtpX
MTMVNLKRTRLVTRLRTWTLMAGLSALVIVLGALIGSAFMWLFAAIAVGANVIGYLSSDRLALHAVGAQPLTEVQAPEVHALARELSARARIPMPRLYLTPGDHANAFATGRDSAHAAVAMTEGLLVNLPLEQIRGALAHELSHIKNRDTLVWLLTATVAGALSAMVSVLGLAVLFGSMGEAGGPLGLLGALAAMLLAPLGAMLLQLGVSRRREYRADATAAELLGSGAPLGDALEEIASDRGPLQIKPVSATMSNANPLAGRTVSHLFATHPPVAERIRRLCVCDAAQRNSDRAVSGLAG